MMVQARKASWHTALLLLLVAVCFCSTACHATSSPSNPRKAQYDPEIEGLTDRLARKFQRRFLKKTDEEITESRRYTASTLNPTFHSDIVTLDGYDGVSVNQVLHMPPPPADDLSARLPWQTLSKTDAKVWVVLLTAPGNDAASRQFNNIFNETVNLARPPTEPHTIVDKIAKVVSEPFEDAPGETVSREDDVGRDDASRRERARQLRLEENRAKAKDIKFAVLDFEDSVELTWAWWVWKVPVVVFVTPSTSPERLYDLRFWKVAFISGLTPEYVLTYIASGAWKTDLKVWTSTLAPGSRNDWIPLFFGRPASSLYDKYSQLPTWLVGILSTVLGGTLISWMHGTRLPSEADKDKKKRTVDSTKVDKGKEVSARSHSAAAKPE